MKFALRIKEPRIIRQLNLLRRRKVLRLSFFFFGNETPRYRSKLRDYKYLVTDITVPVASNGIHRHGGSIV